MSKAIEAGKPLNVLSIDWDYFINVDDHFRIWNSPDGNQNLSLALHNIVWTGYYAANDDLQKVGVNEYDIKLVNGLIYNSRISSGGVGLDHDAILNFLPKRRKVNVYNIDYHHDAWLYRKGEPNCGNWVSFLHESNRLSKYVWVSRTDRDEAPESDVVTERKELKDLIGTNFDIIFLCLSPAWSPPHLDQKFFDSFHIIPEEFKRQVGDRWSNMRKAIIKHKHIIEQFKAGVKQKGETLI